MPFPFRGWFPAIWNYDESRKGSARRLNMQMEKTVKIAAGLAVTLVALGIIANFKDIKRYWRISMM
jgi:hypothetical protein